MAPDFDFVLRLGTEFAGDHGDLPVPALDHQHLGRRAFIESAVQHDG